MIGRVLPPSEPHPADEEPRSAPIVARHDAAHELVEQRHGERGVAVAGLQIMPLAISWLRIGASAVTLRSRHRRCRPSDAGRGPARPSRADTSSPRA